jgi:hypothetical protein
MEFFRFTEFFDEVRASFLSPFIGLQMSIKNRGRGAGC